MSSINQWGIEGKHGILEEIARLNFSKIKEMTTMQRENRTDQQYVEIDTVHS